MKNKTNITQFLPVLSGFFIMGFVDVVGISTSYVKDDFNLSDTVSNLLPMMVFLWFLIFSVPTGLLMNKIGRKNTVLISGGLTFPAMLIPFFSNNFVTILVGFAFLGIGNTILQVSLNPLLANVVSGNKLTSSLTLGQFVKAIASFSGPLIAAWVSSFFGNWKMIFLFFAVVTLLSSMWLWITPIEREKVNVKTASLSSCFSLLKDNTILVFFLGILFVVGIDVGLNTTIPKLLMEKCDISLQKAGFGISIYFIARTVGTLLGSIILSKAPVKKFFMLNMIMATFAILSLFFASELLYIEVLIAALGFTISNVFPIIYSSALKHKPEMSNEISGLMIMGVSGGAFVTFLIGVVSDLVKKQNGGLAVLTASLLYLFALSFVKKLE